MKSRPWLKGTRSWQQAELRASCAPLQPGKSWRVPLILLWISIHKESLKAGAGQCQVQLVVSRLCAACGSPSARWAPGPHAPMLGLGQHWAHFVLGQVLPLGCMPRAGRERQQAAGTALAPVSRMLAAACGALCLRGSSSCMMQLHTLPLLPCFHSQHFTQ